MVLAFNKRFVPPILKGTKIHTIRVDQLDRWHAGRSIQMATGVRTSAYKQFNADRPHLQSCISTQRITIQYKTSFYNGRTFSGPVVKIDGKHLTALQIHELAIADGFPNSDMFFEWFNTDTTGKIIHWTNKKY
jgi:hypothetical protein